MIHNPTETNPDKDHYAVGVSGMSPLVLVQLQELGTQARIALTPQEARHLGQLLFGAADKVDNHNG
jgi:hypothetical protein